MPQSAHAKKLPPNIYKPIPCPYRVHEVHHPVSGILCVPPVPAVVGASCAGGGGGTVSMVDYPLPQAQEARAPC